VPLGTFGQSVIVGLAPKKQQKGAWADARR